MGEGTHTESLSYASSGYSNRMGWGERPALLIIDVCRAYWEPSSPLNISQNPAANASPDSMRRLLEAARKAGLPTAHTKVSYSDPEMRDAGLFWLKAKPLSVWQKGDTRGLDAGLEGLQPRDGEILVQKKYPSAFFGTTLATDLNVSLQRTFIRTPADRMPFQAAKCRYSRHLWSKHIRLRTRLCS